MTTPTSAERLRAEVERLRHKLARAEEALRRAENDAWREYQRERNAIIAASRRPTLIDRLRGDE